MKRSRTISVAQTFQGFNKRLTCPHRRLPRPRKTHHSHCSMLRLTQLNGLPPNCTMTICREREKHRHQCLVSGCDGLLRSPSSVPRHLDDEGSQDDGAEDGVPVDALEDVPFSVNLACVELVEDLHEDEGVEDDGVVFRGRGVERGVPAAVDVKQSLTCEEKECLNLTSLIFCLRRYTAAL